MTSAPRICVTAGDKSFFCWIFKTRKNRLQHCAKHFLNLQEAWHALDGATATAHQRLMWRRDVSALKCAGEYHSDMDCINYKNCTLLLEDIAPYYSDSIARVVTETFGSGAVVFMFGERECLCMSADGVLVFMSCITNKLTRSEWNVTTGYIPFDRRYEQVTEALIFERLYYALDKAFQVIYRSGPVRLMNAGLWNDYKNLLLQWRKTI